MEKLLKLLILILLVVVSIGETKAQDTLDVFIIQSSRPGLINGRLNLKTELKNRLAGYDLSSILLYPKGLADKMPWKNGEKPGGPRDVDIVIKRMDYGITVGKLIGCETYPGGFKMMTNYRGIQFTVVRKPHLPFTLQPSKKPIPLQMAVRPKVVKGYMGSTVQLMPMLQMSNADSNWFCLVNSGVEYESKDSVIVTVNEDGLLTLKKKGEAKVMVDYKKDGFVFFDSVAVEVLECSEGSGIFIPPVIIPTPGKVTERIIREEDKINKQKVPGQEAKKRKIKELEPGGAKSIKGKSYLPGLKLPPIKKPDFFLPPMIIHAKEGVEKEKPKIVKHDSKLINFFVFGYSDNRGRIGGACQVEFSSKFLLGGSYAERQRAGRFESAYKAWLGYKVLDNISVNISRLKEVELGGHWHKYSWLVFGQYRQVIIDRFGFIASLGLKKSWVRDYEPGASYAFSKGKGYWSKSVGYFELGVLIKLN